MQADCPVFIITFYLIPYLIMPRIKKVGLDYFPLDTDFIRNRMLRRIGKSHGEAAILALLQVKCLIYEGQGYYVGLDEFFYDDLSDQLCTLKVDELKAIVTEAVGLGLFDERLFREAHVLTSAEIQRQYLACTARRSSVTLDERFRLISEEEMRQAKEKPKADSETDSVSAASRPCTAGTVELYPGTQSKAKESKANQSEAKETSSSMVPPESGVNPLQSTAGAVAGSAAEAAKDGVELRSEEAVIWQKIRRMTPPDDGLDRNFEGLLLNLEQFHIPAKDCEAIIKMSQYGRIGNPVWQGFCDLRSPKARFSIKLPGKFLISKCRRS